MSCQQSVIELYSCLVSLASKANRFLPIFLLNATNLCYHFGFCFSRRLAKSTLLLIPLFGINYILFAYIPENMHVQVRMVFDLVLGSFQVTYFFLAFQILTLSKEFQSSVHKFIFCLHVSGKFSSVFV